MTPKKRTSKGTTLVQTTVRLTSEQLRFLEEESEGNQNEALRRVLDDARTLFGLPSPMVERMEQHARELGIDFSTYEGRRELVIRCLTECYRELIAKDVRKKG